MKRLFLWMVSFLLIAFQFARSADTVVQTVGLTIGKKAVNYNIDRVLKKVVLSVALSNNQVRVVSSEKDDLEMAGVGILNGSALLKTEKKQGYYQIGLYEFDLQTGKTGELFDGTLRLSVAQFSETVDDVALKVLDRIAAKFPPKPARELTKIDMIRVKLSEYESPDGYWSLTVTPSYDMLTVYFSISSSNMESGNLKYFAHNGGGLDVEAVYRLQQWTFGFRANVGGGYWSESATGDHSACYDFGIRGIFGYGLFGSLVVLGLEPRFYRGTVSISGATPAGNNYIPAANVVSQRFALGFFLQVNISKDYNLTASTALPTPLLYVMNADFSRGGVDPSYNNLNILPYNGWGGGDGMNFELKFNFRLFGDWWLNLFYENLVGGYNYESGGIDPNQYFADTAGSYRVKKVGYGKTRLALGVRYDF